MKKHIFLTLAALVALVSCNKDDTVQPAPFQYQLTNAKINLGSSQSKGPVGCIELNDNGTYYAEIFADRADYEGLEKYLQVPFERILVGTKDRKAARYVSGNYSADYTSYQFDGLGTLSFEPDLQYAHYSFPDGKEYRDRTGFTLGAQLPSFQAANGRWTPCEADVKVYNLGNNTQFHGTYSTVDFRQMAADVAYACVPALEPYLPLFEGYTMARMEVSRLNTFVIDYTDGKMLGGYWTLDPVERTVSKTLEDKRLLSTLLTVTPAISGNTFTLSIYGQIKMDNLPAYTLDLTIKLVSYSESADLEAEGR